MYKMNMVLFCSNIVFIALVEIFAISMQQFDDVSFCDTFSGQVCPREN